jgi:hypothetical protein
MCTYSNCCISARLDGTPLKTEQAGTAHPSILHRDFFHRSGHTEPLHQDRISRCDRGYEAVFRSLIVLHFRSRWVLKAEGSVQ